MFKETKIKKKSLTALIFISTLLVGGVVYFLCSAIFIVHLNKYYEGQIYKELQLQAQFVTKLLEVSDVDAIKEIIQARSNRYGQVERFSNTMLENTMLEKTLYFALLTDDGNIVRISSDQHSVAALIIGLTPLLTCLFVLAVIVSVIIATLISKK